MDPTELASATEADASALRPLTLIGRRGDAVDSAREFLGGNEVPIRWIDLDRDPVAGMLRVAERLAVVGRLPVEPRMDASPRVRARTALDDTHGGP